MIHYHLRCATGHVFETWFRSIAAFEAQSKSALVECPQCGSRTVTRALMAPAINSGVAPPPPSAAMALEPAAPPNEAGPAGPAAVPETPAGAPGGQAMAAAMPPALRAALQKLRADVERQCDHVGEGFADEARAIHRGERPARGIYGESTPEQAEALAEEGIAVARIPWVPRADG